MVNLQLNVYDPYHKNNIEYFTIPYRRNNYLSMKGSI